MEREIVDVSAKIDELGGPGDGAAVQYWMRKEEQLRRREEEQLREEKKLLLEGAHLFPFQGLGLFRGIIHCMHGRAARCGGGSGGRGAEAR